MQLKHMMYLFIMARCGLHMMDAGDTIGARVARNGYACGLACMAQFMIVAILERVALSC